MFSFEFVIGCLLELSVLRGEWWHSAARRVADKVVAAFGSGKEADTVHAPTVFGLGETVLVGAPHFLNCIAAILGQGTAFHLVPCVAVADHRGSSVGFKGDPMIAAQMERRLVLGDPRFGYHSTSDLVTAPHEGRPPVCLQVLYPRNFGGRC